MQAFPLLVQWSSDPDVYHGFLSVMDKELEVCIEVASSRANILAADARPGARTGPHKILASDLGCIFGTEELREILAGREKQLQQKMREATDMTSFLIELVDTLEGILSSRSAEAGPQERPISHWSHITEQLDALGWNKITHLGEDLNRAQIELSDASQRKHTLTISFPPGYPSVPLTLEPLETPECDPDQHSLSQRLNTDTTVSSREESDLQAVIRHAEKQLELYKEFWDVMQDIDENTWVIDPEKPTGADRVRRCALGNHCSIQMTIDPLSPLSMPDTRLFGPTSNIEPMRIKLYQNAGLWDEKIMPRKNLEVILELANGFPSPVSANKDEMNIECGICYSFRFEGQVPDQLCSHSKCQQPFHRVCLYEWLRSIPTTRQSFNTLFGACPYCSETITTTAPRT
ncbi:WD-repeat region-domain-containing protein [Dissophora ornata]|nr:WD-repeat region-domain-containing protein [Dissophora ornata]